MPLRPFESTETQRFVGGTDSLICIAKNAPNELRGITEVPECSVIDHRSVEGNMGQQLDIGKFLTLKKQELGTEDNYSIVKLEVCTQSIHRWLQYCE